MRTTNGGARPLMTAGLALFGMAVVPALIGAFAGGLDASMIRSGAMLFVTGAGTFAVGALRLPGWARVRQQQMDTIAERLLLVTRMSPIEPSALPSAAPSALPPRAPASLPAATEE